MQPGFSRFPIGCRELRVRRDSIALFVPQWERARTIHPNTFRQHAPDVPSAWLQREQKPAGPGLRAWQFLKLTIRRELATQPGGAQSWRAMGRGRGKLLSAR